MKRSKELESLSRRLDEVRMSDHDRLRARAHLERAEALAEMLAVLVGTLGRLLRTRVLRPLRRAYGSAG